MNHPFFLLAGKPVVCYGLIIIRIFLIVNQKSDIFLLFSIVTNFKL